MRVDDIETGAHLGITGYIHLKMGALKSLHLREGFMVGPELHAPCS
jgi:hypothetical protein